MVTSGSTRTPERPIVGSDCPRFSRAMALPHVVIWTPLVILLTYLLTGETAFDGAYRSFLILLVAVDAVSLGFDYVDAVKWWKGERDIA